MEEMFLNIGREVCQSFGIEPKVGQHYSLFSFLWAVSHSYIVFNFVVYL